MRTVERVARGVQSGEIDATWDGYLTAVIGVLPWSFVRINRLGSVDALASACFLPVQDGRLISAEGPARVFFQPVRGIDDEAELVGTVPDSLTQRIAFIHGDVVLAHEEGSRRRSTEVHKFLDGRFARGFRREEIIREVVLSTVPPTPVAFGSEEAELCADCWAGRWGCWRRPDGAGARAAEGPAGGVRRRVASGAGKPASVPAGREGPAKTCGRSGRSWVGKRASACARRRCWIRGMRDGALTSVGVRTSSHGSASPGAFA